MIDIYNRTPLDSAFKQNNQECIDLLLNYNAKKFFELSNYQQTSPLHMAVKQGKIRVAEFIFANIYEDQKNAINYEGNTALITATLNNNLDMVKLLIDRGVDINKPDKAGYTALHNAAYIGNVDIVRLLIENGANINAENLEKMTPLFLAARHNYKQVVKILLDREDTNINLSLM